MTGEESVAGTERDRRSPSAWNDAAEGCLTVRQAVEFSGLSRTRVYELLREGVLRSTTVGTRRLIYRRSLRELLARGAANWSPDP